MNFLTATSFLLSLLSIITITQSQLFNFSSSRFSLDFLYSNQTLLSSLKVSREIEDFDSGNLFQSTANKESITSKDYNPHSQLQSCNIYTPSTSQEHNAESLNCDYQNRASLYSESQVCPDGIAFYFANSYSCKAESVSSKSQANLTLILSANKQIQTNEIIRPLEVESNRVQTHSATYMEEKEKYHESIEDYAQIYFENEDDSFEVNTQPESYAVKIYLESEEYNIATPFKELENGDWVTIEADEFEFPVEEFYSEVHYRSYQVIYWTNIPTTYAFQDYENDGYDYGSF